MKKTDKKIISIFLVLIILISQFVPVVTNAETIENKAVTLEEYLIGNGVDANEDGKISDEEWKKVKNLILTEGVISDFNGIEKAINLRNLTLENINPELIDFSKLVSLSNLNITYWESDAGKIELDLTKTEKLSSLNIYIPYKESIIDLTNLKYLSNIDCNAPKSVVKFSSELSYAYMDLNIEEGILDLTNKTSGWLYITTLKWDNVKLPENAMVEYSYYDEDEKICYFISDDEEELKMHILEGGGTEYRVQNIESEENDIIEIVKRENTNCYDVNGKKSGEQEIIITDAVGRKVKRIIVVLKDEYIDEDIEENEKEEEKEEIIDKSLENTGITAEFIENKYASNNYNKILKSNGELWQLESWESEATIIETNVKKYVSESVYVNPFHDLHYEFNNILYNDGILKVSECYMYEKSIEIEDVIDVDRNVFLKSNGDLYAIRYSYVTEEFYEEELIASDVKRIVGDFIIKNDGTLWFSLNNGAAVNFGKDYKNIGNQDIKYQMKYGVDFVDSSDIRWNYNYNTGEFKAGEKYVKDNNESSYYLVLEDGNLYSRYYDEEKYIFEKGELILDNVSDMYYKTAIRTDGTIWKWNETKGRIEKIKARNPQPVKDEYMAINSEINLKKIGEEDAVVGLKVNQTVEEFLKENNFKEGYITKVYDIENKEIVSDKIIGTGTIIKLFNEEEIVKEYKAIIYGDTDGNGVIDPIDALTLIKLINEKIELKDPVYIEAGKVTGETDASAYDALTIIKSLNGKAEINQGI